MRPTSRVFCRHPAPSLKPRPLLRLPTRYFSFTGRRCSQTEVSQAKEAAAVHDASAKAPFTDADTAGDTSGKLRMIGHQMRTYEASRHYLAHVTKRVQKHIADGKLNDALTLWKETIDRRVQPDSILAVQLINGSGSARNKVGVKTVLEDWQKIGLQNGAASVIQAALFQLERMGEFESVAKLFEQNRHFVEHSDTTLTTAVLAYIHLGRMQDARDLQRFMLKKGLQLPATVWTTMFNSLGAQRKYDDIISLVTEMRSSSLKISEITYVCVVNHLMNEPRHFDFARSLVREMDAQGMPMAAEVAHVVIRRLAEAAKRQRSTALLEQAIRRWKGRARIELEVGTASRLAQSLGDLAHMLLEVSLALSRPLFAEELLRHPAVLRVRTSQQIAVMHRKIALAYARTYSMTKMMDHYDKAAEVMVCDSRAYSYILAACIHTQSWPVAERLIADMESYRVPLTGYLVATVVNLASKANLPDLGKRYWQRWLELLEKDTPAFTEIYTAIARFVTATGDLSVADQALKVMSERGLRASGFFYACCVDGAAKSDNLTALEGFIAHMAANNVVASVRIHDAALMAYSKHGREIPESLQAHLRKALTLTHSSSYSEFGVATQARE